MLHVPIGGTNALVCFLALLGSCGVIQVSTRAADMRKETQGTCGLALVVLSFEPRSLIFIRLNTSLSQDRGVSVFSSSGDASPQASDEEPEETQGKGSSKKDGNRVAFASLSKEGLGPSNWGKFLSVEGEVGWRMRGCNDRGQGCTHGMGNVQKRKGQGRAGNAG